MNKYTVINPHEPFRVLNTHVHNIDGIAKVTVGRPIPST